MACKQKEAVNRMISSHLLTWTFSAFVASTIALPTKEILILGGNGFIGSETTTKLLENNNNITLLNRGNVYYDSKKRIKPFISRHIACDRQKSLLLECKEFKKDTRHYDVVIDFTSYTPVQIRQVAKMLAGKVGLYIFISTEAVYEVSSKNNSNPTREEEAVRPISPRRRRELQKEEPYGDKKFACEEFLEKQQEGGGFPFIILRLPVVIGPRDTTFRWWTYQLWVLTHTVIHHPVHIPNGVRSALFSLVYVNDVADVIKKIINMEPSRIKPVLNMAINLAMKEHVTLPRIIKDIAKYYGIDHVQQERDDNSTWYAYPLGTKGPLDISLAQRVLDWDPVPWEVAVENTCDFYHHAMTKSEFSKEKETVLADMVETVVPEEYYDAFLMKLKQHFGEMVFDGIDLAGGIPDGAPEIETVSDGSNDSEMVVDEL